MMLGMAPRAPIFVLAHRGGRAPSADGSSAEVRENTEAAFRRARRAGADGVELDVRQTADGELVVVHDVDLPGVGPVHTVRSWELPPWVPSLDAALDACGDGVVDIEIKNAPTEPGFDPDQRVAHQVVALLANRAGLAYRAGLARRAGLAYRAGHGSGDLAPTGGTRPRQHWLVTSFWPDTLAATAGAITANAVGPEWLPDLGLLVHPAFDALDLLDRAADLGCTVLLPHWSRTTEGLVERAADAGLAVVAWTVNGPDEVRTAARAGALGVIADDVTAAVAVRDGR